MNGSGDSILRKGKESLGQEDSLYQVTEKVSSSAMLTAALATDVPLPDIAKAPGRGSEPRQDSDTEPEEELEDSNELIKHVEVAVPTPLSAVNEAAKQDESQNGISSFPPYHQTAQKTYSKKRKSIFGPPRENSTASTIPDSDQKSEVLDEVLEEEDAVGSRLFKVARQDEGDLEESVVLKSSIGKLQTPTRPSPRKAATQPKRNAQRASKTPAALTPNSSASSSKTPNKFLLSGSKLSIGEKSWLKKQGTIVEDVPGRRSKFICVVRHRDLPATTKVLRSLIADKPVVSDQWVTDSKVEAGLLDPSDYLHADLRGSDIKQNERRYLWKGKTLFFTTAAAKSYGDDWAGVRIIASEAGAAQVVHGNANKGGEILHDKANTILFGVDVPNDRDAQTLLSQYSRTVYDRKMFSTSIIRADVDLEADEFKLMPSSNGSNKSSRGRG